MRARKGSTKPLETSSTLNFRPEGVSRCRAGLVHSLVVVGRKHANGVFVFRRSATQRGATQDGGPESGNFRLQRKHSCHDFLTTKGSVMSVWLKPCGLE